VSAAHDARTTDLVVCTGRVAAPRHAVWDLVSDFGGVARWSIGPVSCTVDGVGVGAVRTVERGGRAVRERLERWDATEHSFSYSFVDDLPLPIQHLVATIALRGGDVTDILWSARGEVTDDDRGMVRDTLERFFSRRIGELQAIAPRLVAERG
jgi:Polyketide cyclase / dehydrase and lipid transport